MPATLPQILEKAASAVVGAHRCAVHQLGKRSSLQGRAADQPAVYVRLHHYVVHVTRLDRTAVEDTNLLRKALAPDLSQEATDASDGILRILGGSGLAGPDSPDRLVSEDDGFAADPACVRLLEDRPDLPRDLLPHRARVPLLLGLPDADNGQEASACGASGLLRHGLIRFSKDFTPLRVPDDYRPSPDIQEHRRRDFSGKR